MILCGVFLTFVCGVAGLVMLLPCIRVSPFHTLTFAFAVAAVTCVGALARALPAWSVYGSSTIVLREKSPPPPPSSAGMFNTWMSYPFRLTPALRALEIANIKVLPLFNMTSTFPLSRPESDTLLPDPLIMLFFSPHPAALPVPVASPRRSQPDGAKTRSRNSPYLETRSGAQSRWDSFLMALHRSTCSRR